MFSAASSVDGAAELAELARVEDRVDLVVLVGAVLGARGARGVDLNSFPSRSIFPIRSLLAPRFGFGITRATLFFALVQTVTLGTRFLS